MYSCVLVLHNIRSAHNVGSMFRSADGAGVERIVLSGYTPGPLDPRGKERPPFIKVSLGAEKVIPFTTARTLSDILKRLKKDGYTIIAIEQDQRARPIFSYSPAPEEKLAIVMGNEVRGISKQSLRHVDKILYIPMHGTKESLNVGVAAGIAMFTLLQQKV